MAAVHSSGVRRKGRIMFIPEYLIRHMTLEECRKILRGINYANNRLHDLKDAQEEVIEIQSRLRRCYVQKECKEENVHSCEMCVSDELAKLMEKYEQFAPKPSDASCELRTPEGADDGCD